MVKRGDRERDSEIQSIEKKNKRVGSARRVLRLRAEKKMRWERRQEKI